MKDVSYCENLIEGTFCKPLYRKQIIKEFKICKTVPACVPKLMEVIKSVNQIHNRESLIVLAGNGRALYLMGSCPFLKGRSVLFGGISAGCMHSQGSSCSASQETWH